MIAWITALLTILFIGIGIGGLLVSKKMLPHHFVLFGASLLFGFSSYLGMVAGTFLISTLTGRIVEVIVALVCLLLVGLCFMRFHPTMGYFHREAKGIWSLIIFLFFLLGMEWALYEMSRIFIVLATPLFLFIVVAGANLQLQVITKMWRMTYAAFLPLLWILIISIMKLL